MNIYFKKKLNVLCFFYKEEMLKESHVMYVWSVQGTTCLEPTNFRSRNERPNQRTLLQPSKWDDISIRVIYILTQKYTYIENDEGGGGVKHIEMHIKRR